MQAEIKFSKETIRVDLSKPIDISIRLKGNAENPLAWYLDAPKIDPVQDGDWIAKVAEGASVNFNTIHFNPHAHGTHTECVGHISKEFYSVQDSLKTFFFQAKLITLKPKTKGDDLVFTKAQLQQVLSPDETEALIIRTLPNSAQKKTKNYSHSNWPYLPGEAAEYIRECGIQHLLIDLPSVDKEKDEGRLSAHKAFWNYPENTRHQATITEMIFVDKAIRNGSYLLNLQMASFENDASPSKPILYEIL